MRHPNQAHSQQAAKVIRRQQIRDTVVGPEKAGVAEAVKLKECFESFQLKYDVDRSSPWWKRVFFWFIYLPFARFSFFKVGIVPMDHVRCARCHAPVGGDDGQLGWLERQTVWPEKWQALQDAERYPFGGVQPLPFNIAEQEQTCAPLSQFPNSPARDKYEQLDEEMVPIRHWSIARLDRKITETDPVVRGHRIKPA